MPDSQYPARIDLSTRRVSPAPSGLRGAGEAAGPFLRSVLEHLPTVMGVQAVRRGAVATQGGAADFIEGALGLDTGTLPRAANSALNPDRPAPSNVVVRRAAAPAARAATAAASVPASAAPGHLPYIPITPDMERRMEVSSILSRPHTLVEGEHALAMQPAPVKPASGANAVAEAGASVAGQLYVREAAEAQALMATDPDEGRKRLKAAETTYMSRLATYAHGNPADLAQAGLLPAAEVP